MSKLVFKNISKIYPSGVISVADFNFEVEEGEFIVFYGVDESSKTTLLKLVAGMEDVTAGEIVLDGECINDLATKDREIAYISQNFSLNPQVAVFENIAYGLQLRKVPEDVIKDKVEVTAEILGLSDLLQKKTKLLSAIQKQRVVFARMIVREPKIYLFDEPFSNFDDKTREKMRTEIFKLRERIKCTILYATKDLTEAMALADRLVVIKNGFIQQVDLPQNVYNYPSNYYVAALVGNPQMNIFQGVLSQGDVGVWACFSKTKIKLSDKCVARLKDTIEFKNGMAEVAFGLRTEDMQCILEKDITKEQQDYTLPCIVKMVEEVEGEVQVFASVGEDTKDADTLIATAQLGFTANNKDKVGVVCNTDYLHIFNLTTGECFLNNDEGFIKDERNEKWQSFKPLTTDGEEEVLKLVKQGQVKQEETVVEDEPIKNSLNAKYEEKQVNKDK